MARAFHTPLEQTAEDQAHAAATLAAMRQHRVPPSEWAACGLSAGALVLSGTLLAELLAWTLLEHLVEHVLPTWRALHALVVKMPLIGTDHVPVVVLVTALHVSAIDILALPDFSLDTLLANTDADALAALRFSAPLLVTLGLRARHLALAQHCDEVAARATWRRVLALTPELLTHVLERDDDAAAVARVRRAWGGGGGGVA